MGEGRGGGGGHSVGGKTDRAFTNTETVKAFGGVF